MQRLDASGGHCPQVTAQPEARSGRATKKNPHKRFSRQETRGAGVKPNDTIQTLLPASSDPKRMFISAPNPPRSARSLPRRRAGDAAGADSAGRLLPVNDCMTRPLPFGQPLRLQAADDSAATHAPTLPERPVP